jgi:hypothetical protein
VFGVPRRAFKYQIDPQGEGKTQRVVLRLVVFGASILTDILFMLLHFDGGPFHNVNAYTLLAGVIFTIFLLAPGYRSVAKAGWTRPIYPVPLRSFAQHGSEAAEEVKIALRLRRAARRAQNSAMAIGSRDSGNSHKYSPVRTSDDNRISTPRSNSNRPEKQAQDKGNGARICQSRGLAVSVGHFRIEVKGEGVGNASDMPASDASASRAGRPASSVGDTLI